MSQTPIVSTSGMPVRSLGGTSAWKTYQSGDYIVSIETVEGEPACVVWPATSSMLDMGGAYAVCLSAYPYWLHQDGRPTKEAYQMALRGLARMGRELSGRELIRLMSVVIDAYPFVARMPPAKKKRAAPIFEATAQINGKRFHERAI